jgi:hypothetical protein
MNLVKLRRFALAGIVLGIGATLSCSTLARAAVLHLWPGARYANCTPEPRIYCEPGSEAQARAFAAVLPAALSRVEQAQGRPFPEPFRIYTYSSMDSYVRYSGGMGGVAKMSFGEVHLSPRMRGDTADGAAILTHELAHVHLLQHAGSLAMMRLPNWFMEGWPTFVSGGGGTGGASASQAVALLLRGLHFDAVDEAPSLLSRQDLPRGLRPGMYYRQAALMVDYMRRRDPAAFSRLTAAIYARKRFGPAVHDAYGQPLAVLWQDFRADLHERYPAR